MNRLSVERAMGVLLSRTLIWVAVAISSEDEAASASVYNSGV